MDKKLIMKGHKKIILFLIGIIYSIGISQSKPNVIVVLADDIGVGDISQYRSLNSTTTIVETPNIDKLAQQGMIFTDAHAPAALCAPSRYAIMTGNQCYRSEFPWGVWGAYQKSPIKPNQLTLGKLMKNAGYKTAFLGKWHLGGNYYRKNDTTKIYRGPRNKPELDVDIRKIVGGGPQQNGFSYSLTFPAGIQDVPYALFENGNLMPLSKSSKIDYISKENMLKKGVKLDKSEGLGDSAWDPHNMNSLLANRAVRYIEKQSNKEEPFFMYYCSLAVHKPHTPSDSLNGIKISETTPSRHLDMIKSLDVQIGMIIETLKGQNVYENTLIIFTSDNGGLLIPETLKSGHKSSDIYRGGKNQPYEGGTKVPFLASWPNKIKSSRTSHIPVLGLDILATLADLTGQKINKNQALDSSTLLPVLLDKKTTDVHPFIITQGGTGKQVMITKEGWKLIIQIDKKDKTNTQRDPIALFNLNDNPREKESENLINSPLHRSKIKELLDTYNKTRG